MTVTYRLFDGRTWTFANVTPDTLTHICAGIATGRGHIDVASHGDLLTSPDESDQIRIVDIAVLNAEVTA